MEEGVGAVTFRDHARGSGDRFGAAGPLAMVCGGLSADERWVEGTGQHGILSGLPGRRERRNSVGRIYSWLPADTGFIRRAFAGEVAGATAVASGAGGGGHVFAAERSDLQARLGGSAVAPRICADAGRTLRACRHGFGCGGHLLPALSLLADAAAGSCEQYFPDRSGVGRTGSLGICRRPLRRDFATLRSGEE